MTPKTTIQSVPTASPASYPLRPRRTLSRRSHRRAPQKSHKWFTSSTLKLRVMCLATNSRESTKRNHGKFLEIIIMGIRRGGRILRRWMMAESLSIRRQLSRGRLKRPSYNCQQKGPKTMKKIWNFSARPPWILGGSGQIGQDERIWRRWRIILIWILITTNHISVSAIEWKYWCWRRSNKIIEFNYSKVLIIIQNHASFNFCKFAKNW